MKKTISIILCVVMTLSATSCRKKIKDEREGLGKLTDLSMSFQTEATTVPTDTDPVPTDTDPSTKPALCRGIRPRHPHRAPGPGTSGSLPRCR